MNTIICSSCGVEIEVDKALEGQIEARVLAAERHKHADEIEKVRAEAAASARRSTEAAMKLAQSEAETELEIAKKQLQAEVLSTQKRAAAEIELERKRLAEDAAAKLRKAEAAQESLVTTLREDAKHASEYSQKLREEQANIMQMLREEKLARANADLEAQKKSQAEILSAQRKAAAEMELEKKRLLEEVTSRQRKAEAEQESVRNQLKTDAESAKEDSKKLREDLSKLMEQLREERKAKENAEFEAQKKLAASEDKIREDVRKSADEKHHLRQLEMEKKIADMQKSLDEAQRKAAQGSQQNQGEVLELDLENRLREEFPFDDIAEVKKGVRGADLTQTVKNQSFTACGILLWETKNGKWQPAWVPKFKADIREANANIGVIVSQEMPSDYGDMKHLEASVWTVKPRLAPVLASALRTTILQVDLANRNAEGKDVKMETLYNYFLGPEFRHRVEAIVENYGTLQAEIEKEKRAAALRWAHQEKAIRAVIDNTIGMYGDLQGITSRALPAIKTLEADLDDLDEPELTSSQPSLL